MIPNSTPATGSRPIPQKATNKPLKTAASGSKGGATSKATSSARPAPQSRKRTRSVSLSDDSDSYGSPPKRRPPPSSHPSVGEEIWKMFGKDRSQYVERDVFSDDEDMEADATAMEMEEYRRLATLAFAPYLSGDRHLRMLKRLTWHQSVHAWLRKRTRPPWQKRIDASKKNAARRRRRRCENGAHDGARRINIRSWLSVYSHHFSSICNGQLL